MTSYHISNLGSLSGDVRPDISGYVHLTADAVLAGDWDEAGGEMTGDMAADIAEHNRAATDAAESAIAQWQADVVR